VAANNTSETILRPFASRSEAQSFVAKRSRAAAKRKAANAVVRPTDRFGGLGLPHGYMPPDPGTPAGAAEHEAIRELVRLKTGRDIGESFDPTEELRSSGLIRIHGGAKGGVGRLKQEDYASATDLLDAISGKTSEVWQALQPGMKDGKVNTPSPAAQEVLDFGASALDKIGGAGTGIVDAIEGASVPVPSINPSISLARPGASTLGFKVRDVPLNIDIPSAAEIETAIGNARTYKPIYAVGGKLYGGESVAVKDLGKEWTDVASNPASLVPDAMATDLSMPPTSDLGVIAAADSASKGNPTWAVQAALDQQGYSPFTTEVQNFFKARAAKNNWDMSGWDRLTPAEQIYRTYHTDNFWAEFQRGLARNIAETGSVPVGLYAMLKEIGIAVKDQDAKRIENLAANMIAPLKVYGEVLKRDGFLAAAKEMAKNDPLILVQIIAGATKAAGVAAGAAARTGAVEAAAASVASRVPGERAAQVASWAERRPVAGYAATGRVVEGKGATATTVSEVPIKPPTQFESPLQMTQAVSDYPARVRAAEDAGRVTSEGVPYEILRTEQTVPFLVGVTDRNLLGTISLSAKRMFAQKQKRVAVDDASLTLSDRVFNLIVGSPAEAFRNHLQSKAASTWARHSANILQGQTVGIQDAIERELRTAMGKRAPTWLEKERAAFELMWAKINTGGEPVTPGWVVDQFDAIAQHIRDTELKRDPESKVALAGVKKMEAQAKMYRLVDETLLGPDQAAHDAVVAHMREYMQPYADNVNRIIAEALGVSVEDLKRQDYIRLFSQYQGKEKGISHWFDPTFEPAVRALREARVAPRKRLIKAQKRAAALARRFDENARETGWGTYGIAKSRRVFAQTRRELILELRRAERAALEVDLPELADAYRSARETIVLGRRGSAERVAAYDQAVADIAAATPESIAALPEAVVPAAEAVAAARAAEAPIAARLAEAQASRAAALEAVAPGRKVVNQAHIARAERELAAAKKELARVEKSPKLTGRSVEAARARLEAAQQSVDRLRAVEFASETVSIVQRDLMEAQKTTSQRVAEATRILRSGEPVLDSPSFRAAVDAAEGIAGIEVKKKKDFERFTMKQARAETIDEFIARVEASDQHALIHVVQRADIQVVGELGTYEGPRRLDTSVTSKIRPGRLKPSQGYTFAHGNEASAELWKSLIFDVAEAITAESWRDRMDRMIRATSLRVVINEADQAAARSIADQLMASGAAKDTNEAMSLALERVVNAKGVEISAYDFKVVNPKSPGARVPSERIPVGVGLELDPDSIAGVMWQELNSRTLDLNAPGEYYLMPRQVYKGIQDSLASEAFRFKPRGAGAIADKALRKWRAVTLNILPRTAFNNIVGGALLALQAGVHPKYMWYAYKALKGELDGGRRIPFPPELRQRWFDQLTSEITLGGKRRRSVMGITAEPSHLEVGAAGIAWWMNGMRRLNSWGEDMSRLAIYYSQAVPAAKREVSRIAGEEGRFFADARALNDAANELLDAWINGDPGWRTQHEAWLRKSFQFAGDLHRGGKWPSRLRLLIPFQQWYSHMLKLTFWTMPIHYPGRALFLQLTGKLGQDYQDAHGITVPWGDAYVPIAMDELQVLGVPQWVTRYVSASTWWPQATVSSLGNREGDMNVYNWVEGTINPQLKFIFYEATALVALGAGSPALDPSGDTVLRAAKDEFGNDVTREDAAQLGWYMVARAQEQFPLSATLISMASRPSTASALHPVEKVKTGPRIAPPRSDIASILEDPFRGGWRFLLKATTGMSIDTTPGLGPIYSQMLRDTYEQARREDETRARRIQQGLYQVHSNQQVAQ